MTLSDIPAECGQYPGWSEDNSAEIQKGWILKADTIDELIEKMAEVDEAPDAEAVKATIEKYNGYCAAGSDPDFQRTEATLAPVSTPPYYAYPLYPGGCSTLGGPKKDVNAQVLDLDDKPIGRSVCGWLLRQHGEPHLRHFRRQQRREHGLGPHRRSFGIVEQALG